MHRFSQTCYSLNPPPQVGVIIVRKSAGSGVQTASRVAAPILQYALSGDGAEPETKDVDRINEVLIKVNALLNSYGQAQLRSQVNRDDSNLLLQAS